MAGDARAYFNANPIATDMFDLICGEYLGGGVSRDVYVNKIDPDTVIKIETGAGRYQNVMEWRIWEELKHDKVTARWLAPCLFISPSGNVLVQKRTAPLRRLEMKNHGKLPEFLTDVKMSNFGMLNGKLVAHDYGLIRWTWDTNMRKAVWDV